MLKDGKKAMARLRRLDGYAQSQAPPGIRFFVAPWLEANRAWQTGSSNSYFTFQRDQSGHHFGGGLAVEMMPSPKIGVGFGLGLVELGGGYTGTYKVDEFFSKTTETYRVSRQLKLTYVRAPVYVRYTPHLFGPVRAYLLGGLELGLLMTVRNYGSKINAAGESYWDDYGAIDGAFLCGAGLEYWLSANTAVSVGIRYRHGVLGVQDFRPPHPDGGDFPSGFPLRSYSAPDEVDYPVRNRSLSVEVGLKFGPRTERAKLRNKPTESAPSQAPIRTI